MRSKIQQIFDSGCDSYTSSFQPSVVQGKAAHSITACKSGSLGCNISQCENSGTVFIRKRGVPTSKKPLTVLAMPLNILADIPTVLPLPTHALFLLRKMRFPSGQKTTDPETKSLSA